MDLDILDATEHYKDSNGYGYVAISESWKRLCLDFPDSERVQIPPVYRQQSLRTTIDGKPVVIQVWKGNCPHAFRELPGGIGGEVGIYQLDPGRAIPHELTLPRIASFPKPLQPLVTRIASRVLKGLVEAAQANVEWWWPYPQLGEQIEMQFLHPDDDRVLFKADPAEPRGGYWMSRWMGYASYARYVLHETFHGRRVPHHAYDYRMQFSIGARKFEWDAPGSAIRELV